ncbi:hypothetical protein F4859DRAFT_355045 [Xylaria cf. heliscus]|nr:hypothetical protein F4859DRAFT_355045 [Xylaria cf. heliscus]
MRGSWGLTQPSQASSAGVPGCNNNCWAICLAWSLKYKLHRCDERTLMVPCSFALASLHGFSVTSWQAVISALVLVSSPYHGFQTPHSASNTRTDDLDTAAVGARRQGLALISVPCGRTPSSLTTGYLPPCQSICDSTQNNGLPALLSFIICCRP